MKTVLITGKNGQLGQHLIQYFQQKHPEFTIIGTSRHKSFDTQFKIYDESKIISELIDLSDSTSIEQCIIKHKPDYIFNTAANAFVGESWLVPQQHMQVNAVGVLHFLEAIRKHSPKTKFLNLGTSEEFACTIESSQDRQPQDESTKIAPRSPYGCSKASARYLVDIYRESYNLFAIQPWTFNFESELRGEKYVTRKVTKGVARIVKAIKSAQSFEPIVLGNLESYRSWQYAGDVADGLWKIISQAGEPKDWKPYVLSSSETHSIKEFVEEAFKVANIKGSWVGEGLSQKFIIENDVNETNNVKSQVLVSVSEKFFRPMDVTFLYGDSTLAQTELGWSPKVKFKELTKRMVEFDLLS